MPHQQVSKHQRSNAKRMRHELTEAELKLWNELRAHRLMGLSFKRQMPIGPYIVDFACPQHRLIIEVDGSQHGEASVAKADERRTEFLREGNWQVLRFWNDEVLKDIDGVCQHIVAHLMQKGVHRQ